MIPPLLLDVQPHHKVCVYVHACVNEDQLCSMYTVYMCTRVYAYYIHVHVDTVPVHTIKYSRWQPLA